MFRSSCSQMFFQIGVLKNFAKFPESLFQQCCRTEACNFIKKETLAQVFSCEFYKTFKNAFSFRTPLVAASERYL